MSNQQEIANQAQLEKFRAENEIMRKIGTSSGFFTYYFSILSKHRTRNEAFQAANDLHFELFGEFRFSCHNSFLNSLRAHQNKKS